MITVSIIFFFNDTATTEIYTLSLHDALPICEGVQLVGPGGLLSDLTKTVLETALDVEMEDHLDYAKHAPEDRKSTRLNSSHSQISYAVFCLEKNMDC